MRVLNTGNMRRSDFSGVSWRRIKAAMFVNVAQKVLPK